MARTRYTNRFSLKQNRRDETPAGYVALTYALHEDALVCATTEWLNQTGERTGTQEEGVLALLEHKPDVYVAYGIVYEEPGLALVDWKSRWPDRNATPLRFPADAVHEGLAEIPILEGVLCEIFHTMARIACTSLSEYYDLTFEGSIPGRIGRLSYTTVYKRHPPPGGLAHLLDLEQ